MNLLDIIIVNYNSTDYLLHCLRSVYDSLKELPARVIVQDNASEDGVGRVQGMFPQVILTKNNYNMGFSKAVNKGLKQGAAPYAVLLNPDAYVMPGFFECVLRYMGENPDVGIIGPKILNGDGSVQGSARAFPTPFTGLFGRSTLLTKWFPKNPLTRRNVLTTKSDGISPMEVDWVSGACMVVRREALDDVGLIDERFFMYWEDADWCRRMWEKGWKVVYFPQATIVHYVGGSSDKALFRSNLEFHKSSYRLFEKHTKPSFWLLTPLVIGGLGVRLSLVLFSNGMRVWSDSLPSLMKPGKAVLAAEARDKIKVLRMIARLNIGGPAIHVALLADGLDPTRFQSTLIAGEVSPQEGDMSYIIDGSDGKPIMIPELQRELSLVKDVQSFLGFLRILDQEKPDIVHTHTAKAGAIGRTAVFVHNFIYRRKVLAVHTFHGHVFRGYFGKLKSVFFTWAERMLAKITDCIIAISESQKSELCGNYHIAPASKFRVIPLGFDLAPFLTCKAETYQKSALVEWSSGRVVESYGQKSADNSGSEVDSTQFSNSGESNKMARPPSALPVRLASQSVAGRPQANAGRASPEWKIGIVGRLVAIKNHKMFLKSAKIFLNQNPHIRAQFLIVGDGELRDDLMAYCQQERLSNHVVFCGWRRDLQKVYADLDILALTSINEGTPVSIIEAMACSVPIISTDAGGVRELISDFGFRNSELEEGEFEVCERGILVKQGDAEGLAEGLKYLVENHTRMKKEMSGRARLFVEENFSKKRLLRDIESLYLELMGK
ncbi:MAG: glycosyltransferase [Desulfobacterales bacterium]|nr:glycosyltransferase [Desulfobacterales bacterium]